jgi:polysaccharide chain length determinant protein (PEP-CTERM system associated)
MEEPRFDPLDYVSAFNRRKWWFIIPVALSAVVGALLVWGLPRTYQSTATIGVSTPRVSASLVGAAGMDRAERTRSIAQQLRSRPVLERVARLERLDERESIDAAVARLHRSLSIGLSSSAIKGSLTPDQRAQLDSYDVIFTDGTADDAQRVLNRVAQVFVEENSRSRDMRAQDTSEFISAQLEASEQRLNSLEARLRTSKEAHMGRLPSQTGANLQMVAGLQRQIEANATQIRGEQDRLSMIERQIDEMQQGVDAGPISRGTAVLSTQGRIITLRGELAEARLSLTDKHPEVIRLKEELAIAEKAAAAELQLPSSERTSVLQTNPEYRQLLKDRDTAKLRIAELQRQQRAADGSIGRYRSRVEEAPKVEQEMLSLTREYELEREAYGKLKEKRQAAQLNEELQRSQGTEQFSILVPASYPSGPFSPKPLRVLLMALAAGLVIGGAGVMGREYLDRSVHDVRSLRDEFELPVLAEIPRIEPAL